MDMADISGRGTVWYGAHAQAHTPCSYIAGNRPGEKKRSRTSGRCGQSLSYSDYIYILYCPDGMARDEGMG